MQRASICRVPRAVRTSLPHVKAGVPFAGSAHWHTLRSCHCATVYAARVLFFGRAPAASRMSCMHFHHCSSATSRSNGSSYRETFRSVAVSRLGALCTARRFEQYNLTSQMTHGMNKGNKPLATRWLVKSTKDFVTEADSKITGLDTAFARDREDRQVRLREKSAQTRQLNDEACDLFENEMARVRYDKDRRWRKGVNFMLRQGKAFVVVYLAAYFGSLLALYLLFSYNIIPKEGTIEYLCILLQLFIDRETFFARIAAWDTYVDLGFAFVVNEVLELIRFPLVFFLFTVLRKKLTGVNTRVRPSMFVRSAPEV